MKRPTPFEIMRRNRAEREAVPERLRQQRITDSVHESQRAALAAMGERYMEEIERENALVRRPCLLRRAWNYAFGFGANA